MMARKYGAVEEIPTQAWAIQGTVYDNLKDAKYAAMKVFASCNNDGVFVKHVLGGWAIMFWRKVK